MGNRFAKNGLKQSAVKIFIELLITAGIAWPRKVKLSLIAARIAVQLLNGNNNDKNYKNIILKGLIGKKIV